MANIIGNLFGSTTNTSIDETFTQSTILGASSAAMAYLTATLESTTPEVRRLFSEYCTQSVMAQEAVTGLAVKKGWISPYDLPIKQLNNSLQQSQSVLTAQ